MYLEHFGLNEPPFRITPITVFFYSGANRGEILDALIYSVTEAEGIIKVSGEVGSGKTMLCRMLLQRLPKHIETIYLANPSLTRDEMLYAIADALGLCIDGERLGIIMQSIQDKLIEKAQEGKRIVVLVDEAHAMPLDTLEELRLLYNLQVGNDKLLQIILFGQPELNAKLEQPNMRQLKDRIVHHFHMQALQRNTLESYLMFRMRAAGYRGPDIFTPAAIKLITEASSGLMRRVNILADKSLLAAFVEDIHSIEARHVQAAMRDSELESVSRMPDKRLLASGAVAMLLLAGAWWMLYKLEASTAPEKTVASAAADRVPAPAVAAKVAPAVAPVSAPIAAAKVAPTVAAKAELNDKSVPQAGAPAALSNSLYEQRLAAGKLLPTRAVASLLLFSNETVHQERLDGFLRRAEGLGKISEIYLLPARVGNKDGLRILYGAYPSAEAARSAIGHLPKRYRSMFSISVYVFSK